MYSMPEEIAAAATDLANIGAAISMANLVAARATTGGGQAAGAEEVSVAIAAVFGAHADRYHALNADAARFHQLFVQTLTAGGASYASTEVANAQENMLVLVNAPMGRGGDGGLLVGRGGIGGNGGNGEGAGSLGGYGADGGDAQWVGNGGDGGNGGGGASRVPMPAGAATGGCC